MRSPPRRRSHPKTSACRRSASGRPTRISRSASADERVVQVDRRSQKIRDAAGVREKFGVEPVLIPDFLALVGDAADGYPGIAGIGAVSAARLLNKHGIIEDFPAGRLRRQPRACVIVQASCNAQDRRAPLPRRGRAALAWPDRRIRRMCGAHGRAPSAASLSCRTKSNSIIALEKNRTG